MSSLLIQLKWQFTLLQKNNIIGISVAVTLIYGVLLFLLKDVGSLDQFVVALVLNDPSVIGYFFIALAIFTERKQQILPAIFVAPLSLHHYLISKAFALSLIGVICSLGLVISVKGFDFGILPFSMGAMGVCTLSALLGVVMLTFSNEFLKFTMQSIPVFLAFVNIPMLAYLGVIDLGFFRYFFPIQGSLDLIDYGVSGTEVNLVHAYLSVAVWIPVFYRLAFVQFSKRIVHQ